MGIDALRPPLLLSGRRTRPRLLAIAVLLAAGVLYVSHDAFLRSAGGLLIVEDVAQTADVAIATTESGTAGLIELADVFSRHLVARVGLLTAEPSRADRELERRGVMPDPPDRILMALGVPSEAIVHIMAGEGGTSEGSTALAQWCTTAGIRRLIVVTSADHSRRARRAFTRAFQTKPRPIILIHRSRYDSFDAANWWRNRTTLRAGLIEIQKLLLDYARHPFG